MRLLHPFMPFITEELWQNIQGSLPVKPETESIMTATYPQMDETLIDTEAEQVMEAVIEIIRSIRNARAENNVEISKQIEAEIYAGELKEAIAAYIPAIQTLAKADVSVRSREEKKAVENSLALVLKDSEVIIPMASMVDITAERQRLQKEIEQAQAEVERLEKMLSNADFASKAPAAVVEKERNRLASRQDSLRRLQEHLNQLGA